MGIGLGPPPQAGRWGSPRVQQGRQQQGSWGPGLLRSSRMGVQGSWRQGWEGQQFMKLTCCSVSFTCDKGCKSMGELL